MVKKISLTFIISTIQSKKMGPNAYKYRTYNRMLRVLTFFLQVQEGDYLSNINERSKVFRSRREGLIGKIGDTDSVCGTKTFLVVINMVYIFLRNLKLFSSFLKVEEIFIFFFNFSGSRGCILPWRFCLGFTIFLNGHLKKIIN